MKGFAEEKDWPWIATLIGHHFGEEDRYSEVETLQCYCKAIVEYNDEGGIIGYVVYEEDDSGFHGMRSGVHSQHRGKGLGVKMYKRMVQMAKKAGKPYMTYCHYKNMASLNAHVRAGMRVTRISDAVYMST